MIGAIKPNLPQGGSGTSPPRLQAVPVIVHALNDQKVAIADLVKVVDLLAERVGNLQAELAGVKAQLAKRQTLRVKLSGPTFGLFDGRTAEGKV